MTQQQGYCRSCRKHTWFLKAVKVFGDKTEHLVWTCGECHAINPDGSRQQYLPRASVSSTEFAKLPRLLPEPEPPRKPSNQLGLPI